MYYHGNRTGIPTLASEQSLSPSDNLPWKGCVCSRISLRLGARGPQGPISLWQRIAKPVGGHKRAYSTYSPYLARGFAASWQHGWASTRVLTVEPRHIRMHAYEVARRQALPLISQKGSPPLCLHAASPSSSSWSCNCLNALGILRCILVGRLLGSTALD